MSFLNLVQQRRSQYALSDKSPLSDEQLQTLLEATVKQAPSAFNSQSARVLLLLGEKHAQFWQLVREELQKIVPVDKFAPTREKLKSFSDGYGTILFFEEWKTVELLQTKYPAYKNNFPVWAYQSNGMLEFAVWVALAEQGIGASLQHYNPLIDKAVEIAYQLPSSWKLVAQMPFGTPTAPARKKDFLPLEERVQVLK